MNDFTNLSRESHLKSDVDSGARAQHHTLGKGPTQAAPGNHEHLSLVPLGAALPYWGANDPDDYFLILNGRELLRADYPELLAVVALPNGPSGADYFSLPNMEDRSPVGKSGSKALNSTGGAGTASLATANMPAHTHSDGTLSVPSSGAHGHVDTWSGADGANGAYHRRGDPAGTVGTSNTHIDSTTGEHTHDVTGNTGSTGSGTAFSILDPYRACNFIMRVR